MKILVTGGAGLIGSALVKRLINENHSVVVLDDFTYSYYSKPSYNICHDIEYRQNYLMTGAHIERCSMHEAVRLRRLVLDFAPDRVVHLAAIPLVAVATRQVEAAAQSLSTGLINLLEVLRDCNFADRFVYASSSMVYGNFEMNPMPEDGPKNPLNVYGGLKLAGEVLSKSYLMPTNIAPVIVRPSAVYGPTDQHRRVVQKFCENALAGEPVLVSNCNDHIMDFTYIEDIADGFYLATTHDAAAGETFNITYGKARRLSDLVEVLRQYVPDIQKSSEDIDDSDRPTRGSLDISRARDLLGYDPKWPIERGIPAYLSHLRTFESKMAGVA